MKSYGMAGALIAMLAAMVAGVTATPARAASFPPVTFKIVNAYSGLCADAGWGRGFVGPSPCSTTDTNQQWTWNPLTSQLINVGTLECASNFGTFLQIEVAECDASSRGQKWQAVDYIPTVGQRIMHVMPYAADEGWLYKESAAFYLDRTFSAPNSRLAFTFPTV